MLTGAWSVAWNDGICPPCWPERVGGGHGRDGFIYAMPPMPVKRSQTCTLTVPTPETRPTSRGSTTSSRTPSRGSVRARELRTSQSFTFTSTPRSSASPKPAEPSEPSQLSLPQLGRPGRSRRLRTWASSERDRRGEEGERAQEGSGPSNLGNQGNPPAVQITPALQALPRPSPKLELNEALWQVRESAIDKQREADAMMTMRPVTPQEQLLSLLSPTKKVAEPKSKSEDGSPSSPSSPTSPTGVSRGFSRTWAGRGFHARRLQATASSASLSEPAAAPAPLKTIRQLEDGEKIFDLYYWEKVLQQEGDGGKVVVCRPKAQQDENFNFVMKIKSKESLREDLHEEEFVRAQTRLLNFPPHPGVIRLREVLEDETFYYVVMDRASGGPFFECLLQDAGGPH